MPDSRQTKMNSPNAPPGAKGFTLIELLVVVAIIAILIALLLPALSKAREQADKTKCLAELKAIGLSVRFYATDYNDFIPLGKWNDSTLVPPVDWTWEEPMLPYMLSAKATNMTGIYQHATLYFGCPTWVRNWPGNAGSDPQRNVGYGMNVLLVEPDPDNFPFGSPNTVDISWIEPAIGRNGRYFRINDLTNPQARALFADAKSPQVYVNPPSISGGSTTLDARHNNLKWVNIDYADGSAGSATITDARYSVRFRTP